MQTRYLHELETALEQKTYKKLLLKEDTFSEKK